jgi:hypothetical protein
VIPLVIFGVSWISGFKRWRWDIKAPPPDHHLLFTVFFNSFEFVEPLESSIVSFVEPPGFDDGNPMAVEFISSIVEGLDGPSEHRGTADIELVAVLSECLACLDGFLDAWVTLFIPEDESLTSVHPVNLFSLFQMLSPCLRNTTLYFWVRREVYCVGEGVFDEGGEHGYGYLLILYDLFLKKYDYEL